MRVKVLVVAAMVITSVNAGWRRRFGGWFERICRPRQRSSQNPQVNVPGPGPSQSSPRHALFPISPQDSLDDSSDESQYSEPTDEKDTICGDIKAKLSGLQDSIDNLDIVFKKWMPEFYKLMTWGLDKEFMYTDSEGIVTMSTDEKIKAKALRVRLMQEWINLNPGSIPELKEIKAKYTGLEEDYRRVWKEFDESKCVTEEFEHWDPKHILDSGYSPRWHYENDLIVFDEQ
ncbi:hypothetical protein BASA61_004845 [Batrachochytrium salamandrivorans]|nr:hypothetical protein BASA62_003261 [Batrachochytrium salamandrivorans]KAH6582991.1 hypothetical protein BASA61_008240 [Batrachochytrium salamandrivorans]KAH6591646.1 hypothetical protein BASA61_004845 [Batrachochytrium salamandrivorans]KAH9247573.1 hypothetical protein BASA81_014829 [Batrachochytrium salamandrivorans]KAH9271864.1 hypothetical protein BASA83_005966 [Batrachochytrium salamandrivorans]